MNYGSNLFLNQPCLLLPYNIKSLYLYRLCMAAYLFEIELTDCYVIISFALTHNLKNTRNGKIQVFHIFISEMSFIYIKLLKYSESNKPTL